MIKFYCTLLFSFFYCCQLFAISIIDARNQTLGSIVTIEGIALNGSELEDTRYVDDNTAGIALYSTTLLLNIKKGDKVNATGVLSNFNNLLRIEVSSVSILSNGNTLPAPINLNILNAFSELYESRLVKIDNVIFDNPGIAFIANTNIEINDVSSSGKLRVSSLSDLPGEIAPCGSTTVIGIINHSNTTYQLLPRNSSDIKPFEIIPSNIQTNSITLNYYTPTATPTFVEYGTTNALGTSTSNPTLTTNHSITLTGLSPATVYYVKITSGVYVSCNVPVITASNSTGVIKSFFNNSIDASVAIENNTAQFIGTSFADTLAAYIDKSMSKLDIAIYNINNNPIIINAINNAVLRGVEVRMVFDASADISAYNAISLPNASKVFAPASTFSYGLMHNKFVIIDRNSVNNSWVISGSTNWTNQQLEDDKNNIVILQDQSLAKVYTLEFEEMFIENKFGSDKSDNTPHYLRVNGKNVEVWFSPSDGVQKQMKEIIKTADEDLYLALMKFTRTDIAKTLVDSAILANEVFVTGIVNDTAASTESYNIADAEMKDFIIYNGTLSNIFHHKYMLVDPNCSDKDPIVWTGSHNWSLSANSKNDENTLVIHDHHVANQFFQEYNQRYKDLGGTQFNPNACTVSIEENSEALASIDIYPNPSNGILYIDAKENKIQNVIVYSLLNQKVKEFKSDGQSLMSIDLSQLPNQIYYLAIETNVGNKSAKVLIQP